jgi:hypothetical protein
MLYHKLAPSTPSTSSAAASEPITPKKFFIQKLKDKYAFNRKHDPIISQLKKVFIYFYLFYLFLQKKIKFITNKLKVQDQRKKYTPTKQNLKRLDKSANTTPNQLSLIVKANQFISLKFKQLF